MTRRTKAALVAALMAGFLIIGTGAAFADEPPLWLVLACAAFDRDSGPWVLLGCAFLDHPNPQA